MAWHSFFSFRRLRKPGQRSRRSYRPEMLELEGRVLPDSTPMLPAPVLPPTDGLTSLTPQDTLPAVVSATPGSSLVGQPLLDAPTVDALSAGLTPDSTVATLSGTAPATVPPQPLANDPTLAPAQAGLASMPGSAAGLTLLSLQGTLLVSNLTPTVAAGTVGVPDQATEASAPILPLNPSGTGSLSAATTGMVGVSAGSNPAPGDVLSTLATTATTPAPLPGGDSLSPSQTLTTQASAPPVTGSASFDLFNSIVNIAPPVLSTAGSPNSAADGGSGSLSPESPGVASIGMAPPASGNGLLAPAAPGTGDQGSTTLFSTTDGARSLAPTPATGGASGTSTPIAPGSLPQWQGSTAGGEMVLISGSNLGNTTSVLFGDTPGQVLSAGSAGVGVRTPAHAAGVVDVTVSSGTGSSTVVGQFAYNTPATNSGSSTWNAVSWYLSPIWNNPSTLITAGIPAWYQGVGNITWGLITAPVNLVTEIVNANLDLWQTGIQGASLLTNYLGWTGVYQFQLRSHLYGGMEQAVAQGGEQGGWNYLWNTEANVLTLGVSGLGQSGYQASQTGNWTAFQQQVGNFAFFTIVAPAVAERFGPATETGEVVAPGTDATPTQPGNGLANAAEPSTVESSASSGAGDAGNSGPPPASGGSGGGAGGEGSLPPSGGEAGGAGSSGSGGSGGGSATPPSGNGGGSGGDLPPPGGDGGGAGSSDPGGSGNQGSQPPSSDSGNSPGNDTPPSATGENPGTGGEGNSSSQPPSGNSSDASGANTPPTGAGNSPSDPSLPPSGSPGQERPSGGASDQGGSSPDAGSQGSDNSQSPSRENGTSGTGTAPADHGLEEGETNPAEPQSGSAAPQDVLGSVEVIDIAAASRLRQANPVNGQITLYHGTSEAAATTLQTRGITAEGLDDGLFYLTTDPAVAVRYAQRWGGPSPRVAVIRVPEATFQDLFRQGLIREDPVLGPGNFEITPEAQRVINQLLGH